tara:strand:- start:1258 stop:1695 length:438 start_codon:yes stop_codon:yes gene_type:complete
MSRKTVAPKKVFHFKDYTEIRYKEDPHDKTTFLIGRLRSRKNNHLAQIMVLRDNDGDIPSSVQQWKTLKCKLMVLTNQEDDDDYILMEFVELVHKEIKYLIGAQMVQNKLWVEEEDGPTFEDDGEMREDMRCQINDIIRMRRSAD